MLVSTVLAAENVCHFQRCQKTMCWL